MSDSESTNTAPESSNEATANEGDDTTNPDSWSYVPPKPETKDKAEPVAKEEESATKETKAQRERRLERVKINGVEEVVDIDEALKAYGKNKAADQTMREIAEQKKNMARFVEALQNNPEAILGGKNVPISKEARRNLAEKWLTEQIQEELQDPRDVALAERDAKLRAYQEREEAEDREYKEQAQAEQVEQRKGAISKVFAEAMQDSPLSQDPKHAVEAMRDMAMYYRIARQNGENPSPQEIAQHVESATLSRFHNVAQNLTGEQLLKLLGPNVLKEIRQADLAALRSKRGETIKPAASNDSWNKPTKSSGEKEFLSPMDARERAKKILFGK